MKTARIASILLTLATANLVSARPGPVPAARWGTVALPGGGTLSVEIADTPVLRERGYMFREKVPDGEGMVFFMEAPGIHPFWMKNCRTALDIIWLDEAWRIVHIATSVPPCREDPCPTYAPMQRSLYVLEVGPGGAARLSLQIGDQITFIPPSPSQP